MFDTAEVSVPAPDLEALHLLGEQVRPLSAAVERLLPVPEAVAQLLPLGGLQRGTTVATAGAAATTLGLSLVGPVTASGAWVAMVGLPHVGLLAAAEMGVDLERVLLVAEPDPSRWASVVGGLLDAVDAVLVRPPAPVSMSVQRKIGARARERGSVLIQVGGSPSLWAQAPDLVLTAERVLWQGLEVGHGHLRARRVEVSVVGRRGAGRRRRAVLWLPGPDGEIAVADRTTADLEETGGEVPTWREVG